MITPVVAFFNNKGGVGKTSLVYHIAWMLNDLGYNTLVCDLDPQANSTAFFMDEDALEMLWEPGKVRTVHQAVVPLFEGTGDIVAPELFQVEEHLWLLPGDLSLSTFEDELSQQWPLCLDGKVRAFRVTSAFWRIAQAAAATVEAKIVLLDLGPNLGALNRSALVASDGVVVPLGPDLFSLQALENLGSQLKQWRSQWQQRLPQNSSPALRLPLGKMRPLGYVLLQHSVRLDRPVRAYDRWIQRIPQVYSQKVLSQESYPTDVHSDGNCLALIKHYRSLMPMAQEAHKPIFHLKPADGAIGSHLKAVGEAREQFHTLALSILAQASLVANPSP